jgi:hypothetical protein
MSARTSSRILSAEWLDLITVEFVLLCAEFPDAAANILETLCLPRREAAEEAAFLLAASFFESEILIQNQN